MSESIQQQVPGQLHSGRWPRVVDRMLTALVSMGGLFVLAAISLMLLYLAYSVWPLFQGAKLDMGQAQKPLWLQAAPAARLLALEEQSQIGLRLDETGSLVFFALQSGEEISTTRLPLPPNVSISVVASSPPEQPLHALGLSDGSVLLFAVDYQTDYAAAKKQVSTQLAFPFGSAPLPLDSQGRAISQLALRAGNGQTALLAAFGSELQGLVLRQQQTLLRESGWSSTPVGLPAAAGQVTGLHLDPRGRFAYVQSEGKRLELFDWQKQRLLGEYATGQSITTSAQLNGGTSLLLGDAAGGVTQWFVVTGKDGMVQLKAIRRLQLAGKPIVQIAPEARRKGFAALDAAGNLGLFYSTSERRLLQVPLKQGSHLLALSPRADRLLIEGGGALTLSRLHNPYPELSFSALWQKVWYENYPEPRYIWQSSASSADFEPKLSLAPLTFGTLKAAFIALLFAAPLAIAAAIYSACFMAPNQRRKVKPLIELMEALPTVILGFFAALLLAPYVEEHLPGLFALLLLLPLGTLAAAFAYRRLPARLHFAAGHESLLLMPWLVFLSWFALHFSPLLEAALFDGDMRLWLSARGMDYEQRNALIVGLAMGFAVIPNIYSIAEDALSGVPKSLSQGALALGATPWQALVRVLLPAASAGIFSALMLGLGRAVGETMIVLMASGNTPVMNWDWFAGMRTLSANVAVEMPEAAVGSSHYRLLFLSALLLLLLTFVLNTLAEIVRQRLRKRYAAL